ncbi:MAG: AAC(3) family N-acetyltransferase, partial [Solobacterium sp.]|nr:AAC(3) family N-acetyltransferase [Solobacterium sp.]
MDKVIQNIVTKDSLVKALRDLGVEENMILEVHSSLSSFGFVLGGARTVVDALIEAVGESGT